MTYRFINDLFPTQEDLLHYQSHPFPFNLPLVKERLDKKLEEDPDYEVFLPLNYVRIESKLRKDDAERVFNQPRLFVSNRGRVLSLRAGVNKPRFLSTFINNSGYLLLGVTGSDNKTNTIALHRAIACSFIPVSEELLGLGLYPKELEVNHLNGIKTDYSISNLEWDTQHGNVLHYWRSCGFKRPPRTNHGRNPT